jgi:hypothetical protein
MISQRLTLTPAPPNTERINEVAKMLFANVESILDCTSYTCENDQTLDVDDDVESIDEEMPSDNEDNDNLHHNDYDDE